MPLTDGIVFEDDALPEGMFFMGKDRWSTE
jgi:hypothetical protein